MPARAASPSVSPSTASQRAAARRRAERRRRPRLSRLLCWLLAALLGPSTLVHAQVAPGTLPAGANIVVGTGQVRSGANLMIVNQATPRLGIDWQSFNIGSAATVEFQQPGADSIALNRVLGNSGSEIYGHLKANGQVFLTNPHGVLFAPGSKVDVGGLVASTLDLSQDDFGAGRYRFSGASREAVVNDGNLSASAGGYLVLLGQRVDNAGEISVPAGQVVLASGRAATVSISGSGLLSAVVDPAQQAGSVLNAGLIDADGGSVRLTARSAEALAGSLVSNSGLVRARSIVERGGEVWLAGDSVGNSGEIRAEGGDGASGGRISVEGRTVALGGTISAAGVSGAGGRIDITGQTVGLGDARVDASGATAGGRIRVGGEFQGGKTVSATDAGTRGAFAGRWADSAPLANASTTVVDAGTTLDVSASHGPGGTAIVWSNESTTFLGAIDARGAAGGGAVEISSANTLAQARLDALGIGAGGRLLLDPKNIVLGNSGSAPVGNTLFTDNPGSTSNLTVAGLVGLLGAGTAVTLQASNDITLNTDIVVGANGGNLALEAGRSILLNNSITTGGGGLSLHANQPAAAGVVNADRDAGNASITMSGANTLLNLGNGSLDIRMGDGLGLTNRGVGSITLGQINAGTTTIAAAAGTAPNITLQGPLVATGPVSISTGGTVAAQLNLQGTAVTIRAGNDVSLEQQVLATGGAIDIAADNNLTISAQTVKASGPITLAADADHNAAGDFNQVSGLIENSGAPTGSDVRLSGNNVTVGSVYSVADIYVTAAGNVSFAPNSAGSRDYVSGGTRIGPRTDDSYRPYPLPFTFTYYGQSYNSIFVTTNGLLMFGSGTTQYTDSDADLKRYRAIAPAWDDWRTDTQPANDIYVIQPNASQFVVRWNVAHYSNSSVFADFEVSLDQSGRIGMHYSPASQVALGPTIGVSAGDQTHFTFSSRNHPNNISSLPSAYYTFDPTTGNYFETIGSSATGLQAPIGTVRIQAGGSIERTLNRPAIADIQARSAVLDAVNGIGALNGALQTHLSNLSLNQAGNAGTANLIANQGDLVLGTVNAASPFNLNNTGSLTLGGQVTAPSVSLTASGSIGNLYNNARDGGITTPSLALRVGSAFSTYAADLQGSHMMVDTVAVSALNGGVANVNFQNDKAFTVGSADGLNGILTNGGRAYLSTTGDAANADQSITVARPIAAGSGAVRIQPAISGPGSVQTADIDLSNVNGTISASSVLLQTDRAVNIPGNRISASGLGIRAATVPGLPAQSVNTLAAAFSGPVQDLLYNGATLAVGTVDGVQGISVAPGRVVTLHAQGLTLNAPVTAQDAVLDAGSGHFINNVGANAVNAGRWWVYAGDNNGNVYGNLDSQNFAIWGKNFSTAPPFTRAGNRYVFGNSPTVTVTADNKTKTYGEDLNNLLTYTLSGGDLGVTNVFLSDFSASGTPSIDSAGKGASAHAGNYAITVGQGSMVVSGYTLNFVNGNLNVNRKNASLTVADQTRLYGDANPTSGSAFAISGLVPGDSVTGLSVNSSLSMAAHAGSSAALNGNSPVVSGIGNGNDYNFTITPGLLSITPRPVTVGLTDRTVPYGSIPTSASLSASQGSFVFGDTASTAVLSTLAANAHAGASGHISGSSPALVPGNGSGSLPSDYQFTMGATQANISVVPRAVTLTVGNQTRYYGDANPTAVSLVSSGLGFVFGDGVTTPVTVGGVLPVTAHAGASASLTDGTPTFVPGPASTSLVSDYALNYSPGTLTVVPRPVTLTVDGQQRTYGSANPGTGTAQVTGGAGLLFGDSVNGVSVSSPLGAAAHAGTTGALNGSNPVAFTAGNASGSASQPSDYAFTFAPGVLGVTPRPVTVALNNQTTSYGTTPTSSTLTPTIGSFVFGDRFDIAVTTDVPLTAHAGSSGNLTGSVANFVAGNGSTSLASDYQVSVGATQASLSVVPRSVTLTIGNQTRPYGDANPTSVSMIASGEGFVFGDSVDTPVTVGGALPVTAHAGASAALTGNTPTFVPGGLQGSASLQSDYALTFSTGNLTVVPRPVSLTVADQRRNYGSANPVAGTVQASGGAGFVFGDAVNSLTVASPLTVVSHAGASGLLNGSNAVLSAGNASGSASLASDYSFSYVPGALTVDPRPVTAGLPNQTVSYGSVPTTVAMTAAPALLFGDSLSIAVTANLPPNAHAGSTGTLTGGALTLTAGQQNGSNSLLSDYLVTQSNNTSSLTITTRPVTLTVGSQTRYYGDPNPTAVNLSQGGQNFVFGDSVNVDVSLAGALPLSAHAGASTPLTGAAPQFVPGPGSTSLASDYAISLSNGTLTVAPRPITLGVASQTRPYGNANPTTGTATVTGGAGFVFSDSLAGLTVSSALPVTANAGAHGALGGSAATIAQGNGSSSLASDYVFTYTAGDLSITPRQVTLTAPQVSKIYDGGTAYATRAADLDALSLGLVNGDRVAAAGISFTDRNAGIANKSVTLDSVSINDGNNGLNYTVTRAGNSSGSITPKPLNATGTRVYDAGTGVAANVLTLPGVIGGDGVSLSGLGSIATKSVGAAKPVTLGTLALSGADAGNYLLQGASIGITPYVLQVTGVNATDKQYDGTTTATLSGAGAVQVLGQILPPDVNTVQIAANPSASIAFLDKNVGVNKTLVVSGGLLSGVDAGNYEARVSATASITPRPLTVTATPASRIYDGTTQATLQVGDNRVANDVLSIVASGAFGDKNVGINKPVSIGYTVGGADAGNYTFGSTLSGQASIFARLLSIGVNADNKVYDKQFTATASLTDNRVPNDILTLSYASANFADFNAGTGKSVLVSGITVSGRDAGNYTFVPSANATADITRRPLVVTGLAVDNKTYDGTAAATFSGTANFGGVIGNDDVTLNPQGFSVAFANPDAGVDKAVQVTGLTLGGSAASNYLAQATAGTATIFRRPLTLSGVTLQDKVYDRSTTAPYAGTPSLTGFLQRDSVTVAGVDLQFADRNVGANKPVTLTAVLNGNGAGNYIPQLVAGNASISAKPISVAGFGVANRDYDGSVAATLVGAPTLAGVISGDTVGVNPAGLSATFADSHAGLGKTVTLSNVTLNGADGGNYAIAAAGATTLATISPKPISGAGQRVYDGTTDVAPSNLALTGVVQADTAQVALTGAGSVTRKNVGIGLAVSGLSLTGPASTDYLLQSALLDITPRPLTATYAGIGKVYDGTTAATVNASPLNPVGGDTVAVAASGLFASRNAGPSVAIAVSGGVLSGADAANYALTNPTGSTSAAIAPKPVTANYAVASKVYDGTPAATVSATTGDFIGGDSVLIGSSGAFSGAGAKNAGIGKPVALAGALSGVDAPNYALSNPSASATADITPRPVTPTYTGGTRVYDGGVTAPVSGTSPDFVAGDGIALSQTAVFTGAGAKNAGNAKPVQVSGIALSGNDAANYQLNTTTATTTASITPKPVTAIYAGLSKVYDGTPAAQVSAGSPDFIVGDAVSIGTAASFSGPGAKNAGVAKPIAVTIATLNGADAPNYALSNAVGTTSADITPRPLNAGALAADRLYDGTTLAQVTLTDDRVAGDQFTLSAGSTTFADKNAGVGKTVTASGLTLSGSDAANYRLASNTLTATARIAPAPVIVTANSLSKVYGESVALPESGFAAQGLVAGEQIGRVTLASAGTPADAGVVGSPYAIHASDARGGTFDPANYALTYVPGRLTVTPRPVTVATRTVVRYADAANPPYEFSTSVGGFVGGDGIVSVVQDDPPGSASAPGGSIFELRPSGAVFKTGTVASNYDLRYGNGLLIVLPKPPRLGDADGAGGNVSFAVQIDPAEVARASAEIDRTLVALQSPPPRSAGPDAAAPPAPAPAPWTIVTELAAVLSGDSRAITLPLLQRLPLLSLDPQLRRLIFNTP